MDLRYTFKKTEKNTHLLQDIDQLKHTFNKLSSVPYQEEQLLRRSLLKSSVYSARIEGNPLTLEQVESFSPQSQQTRHKIEIFNLLSAYKYLYTKSPPRKITRSLIFKLHQLVMRRLGDNPGHFRTEPGAIFNQAGLVIYLPPSHTELPGLIDKYVALINHLPHHPTVSAGIAHFLFEKIHPFLDGNGRVGRLVAVHILNQYNYGFRGLLSLEEYIDHHKDSYYLALEPYPNVNPFAEYFLQVLKAQAERAIQALQQLPAAKPEDKLLPRRQEVLAIIRDHPYCSFNFLSRRFPAINPKTLHYDLNQLQKHHLIIKVGVSRGATYLSPFVGLDKLF